MQNKLTAREFFLLKKRVKGWLSNCDDVESYLKSFIVVENATFEVCYLSSGHIDLDLTIEEMNIDNLRMIDSAIVYHDECGDVQDDLTSYFDGQYAIEALSDEKFCNLKMYIEECIKCINSNLMISATILLRCCVEDFVNIKLQPKKGQIINLGKKMDELINMIDNDDKDFKIFKDINKIEDVKSFLHKIRGVGNETAHLNGGKLKDLAGSYNIEYGLKMFCLLVTYTILADKVEDLRLESARKMLKGKSFKLPEQEKANDNFAEEVVEDEEIPF